MLWKRMKHLILFYFFVNDSTKFLLSSTQLFVDQSDNKMILLSLVELLVSVIGK